MSTAAVTRDIVINASPETVYDVVSQPEHMSKWFSDDADFEPVAGTTGVLSWRDKATNQTSTIKVTVVTADRPNVFSFHWVSPERQREMPTATDPVLVEFRITPEANGTRLVVSESLDTVEWDDDAKAAYAADHNNGWGSFLPRLRDYAEGLVGEDSA